MKNNNIFGSIKLRFSWITRESIKTT